MLVALGDLLLLLLGTTVDLKTIESFAVEESGGDLDCALLAPTAA